MASSSSRGRGSSPFSHYRKPSSPYSSCSSTSSSLIHPRHVPRATSSPVSSFHNTYSSSRSDSMYAPPRSYGSPSLVGFPSSDDLVTDDAPRGAAGDSISVTIRFRPLSEREYQRGDEIAWYADGDKAVRNEYNPASAAISKGFSCYLFDDDCISFQELFLLMVLLAVGKHTPCTEIILLLVLYPWR